MTLPVKISPNPIWQLLDQSGAVNATLNNDGSTPTVAAAPGTAYGAAGFLSKIKVLISAAQLKALKATPLTLIPAPGANKFIQIIGVSFRYLFLTSAFTLNAGTIKLFHGPVANAKALTASVAAGLVDQVVNGLIADQPILTSGVLTDAQGLNVDIELGNDGAAEMTVGLGSLEVVLEYKIISLP